MNTNGIFVFEPESCISALEIWIGVPTFPTTEQEH